MTAALLPRAGSSLVELLAAAADATLPTGVKTDQTALADAVRHDPCLDLLDRILAECARQDSNYPPFEPTHPGVRLGVAVLEDEVREARDAWRDDRRVPGWPLVEGEVVQVAAVALRLLLAIGSLHRDLADPRPGRRA